MRTTKLNRRAFLGLFGTTVAASALAACTPAATPTPKPEPTKAQAATAAPTAVPATKVPPTAAPAAVVEVDFWQNDPAEWQKVYQDIVDAFNKSQSQYKGVLQYSPGDWGAKLNTMIASGAGPTSWMAISSIDMPRNGQYEQYDAYMDKAGVKADRWFSISQIRGMYKGHRYTVPRDCGVITWGYNKAILDQYGIKPPTDDWTFDDFLTICKATTNKEKGTWGTAVAGASGFLWNGGAFPFNLGFKLNSDDGRTIKGYLDSPESIAAIQFNIDLIMTHKVAPSGDAMKALGDAAMFSGKVALGNFSNYDVATLKDIKWEWGCVTCPAPKKDSPRYSWGGLGEFMMWSGAKADKKAGAAALTLFAALEEGSTIGHKSGAWWSPCPSVWTAQGSDKDKLGAALLADAKRPSLRPFYERLSCYWDTVSSHYGGIYTRVMENGEKNLEAIVKDEADKAQKAVDDYFAKNPDKI